MWPYSGRLECVHLQGGKNVAVFMAASMWSYSGRQEYGHIQGGKNLAIFRMARTRM
jgi:hypothetical protein